jgi:hypothetical protein
MSVNLFIIAELRFDPFAAYFLLSVDFFGHTAR